MAEIVAAFSCTLHSCDGCCLSQSRDNWSAHESPDPLQCSSKVNWLGFRLAVTQKLVLREKMFIIWTARIDTYRCSAIWFLPAGEWPLLIVNVKLNRLHHVISEQQKCLSFLSPHWASEAPLNSWAGVLPNFGTCLRKKRITAGWTDGDVYTYPFFLCCLTLEISSLKVCRKS